MGKENTEAPKEEKADSKPAETKAKESVPKEKSWTIARAFRELAPKGAKSKDALADSIVDFLAKKGVTENVKHNPIKKDNVLSQVNSICRDIGTKEKAGAKTKGWWTEHIVVDTDTSFKTEKKVKY